MKSKYHYINDKFGQNWVQGIHRDRIAQVYFGRVSDDEIQRRARARVDWITEHASGKKIYDIGCSEGITAIKLAQMGFSVDAIDANNELIEYAQNLVEEMAPNKLEI